MRTENRKTKLHSRSQFGGLVPRVTRTRMVMATKFAYAETLGSGQIVDHFVIDWRGLERNKYAPWKRGELSGLSQD